MIAIPFLFPGLFALAWIAFVPLFWIIEGARIRDALLWGWLVGGIANLAGFYWLPYTIRVFGGFSYPLSVIVFLLYAVLEALQFALFALLVRIAGFGPLFLFPALLWTALEFFFPHLFPWYLANTQAGFSTLIQSADLVGPYGASFLLVWLNTTIYAELVRGGAQRRVSLAARVVFGVLAVTTLVYGQLRLSAIAARMAAAPKLTVAAVQGNIDVGMKWDPAKLERNLEIYRDLTKTITGASLIIWPETAVETWLPEQIRELPREILPPLSAEARDFLFGALSFRGEPNRPGFAVFNSAFLAGREGKILGRYHKQVLLAFGEYIPFAPLLSKIPGVPELGGFGRGDGPRAFALSGGARVAPLICYEDLMPELSRRFVAEQGAQLLVNITNDAWYGRSAAPWQHARMAQWRPIETRRALVRVTNTGVTSVIDARGVMVQTLPLFVPAVLTAPVALMEGETFYVRFGDWFAWAASLLSLLVLLRQALRKRSKSSVGSNRSNR
ncbi:MAG: apolipoprotein N-acyltransferase [Deltaproteobacteria bacterium]|nr:apolipoprotein N-acyltransferase [Deltaproteobacteria bacterium]